MTTLQEARRALINARDDLHSCIRWHNGDVRRNSQTASERVAWEHQRLMLQASVNRIEDTLRTALAQQGEQQQVAVSDAMVEAYLTAQRKTVEEADRFGRPNVGGLHTNTVREACRNGISAALAAAPAPVAQQGEQQVCAGCGIPVGDVHMSTCKSGKWPSRVSNGDTAAPAPAPAPQPAQDVPEVGFGNIPTKFLANGTRFKLSFDTRGKVSSLWNFMDELDGRWVALVAAEDDCHLQSAQPVAQPLSDARIEDVYRHIPDFHQWTFSRAMMKFARAIEASHGIREVK